MGESKDKETRRPDKNSVFVMTTYKFLKRSYLTSGSFVKTKDKDTLKPNTDRRSALEQSKSGPRGSKILDGLKLGQRRQRNRKTKNV
jgi:hypothetical protein